MEHPPHEIPGQGVRRSKRVLLQLRLNEKDGLERIAALSAFESAGAPDLQCNDRKYASKFSAANKHLQMSKWAYDQYFVGAIINDVTG